MSRSKRLLVILVDDPKLRILLIALLLLEVAITGDCSSNNMDATLMKNFVIKEKKSLQVRLEAWQRSSITSAVDSSGSGSR